MNDILGPSDQGVKSPPIDAPSTEIVPLLADPDGAPYPEPVQAFAQDVGSEFGALYSDMDDWSDFYVAALESVARHAHAHALRDAADQMEDAPTHSCFRSQGCVDCGRQKERLGRIEWLRRRAENYEPVEPHQPPALDGRPGGDS